MKVTMRSPYSDEENTLDLPVSRDDIERWRGGELIQNVMPHLTADQREFLISGLYPGEFEQMFPPEDDSSDY